jgi:DNA-binding Xre family transcriptional regulator
MMSYNFDRVFKARGIDRPFSHLKKAGFSENFAVKVNQNKVVRMDLKDIEQLCLLLRCTPNDFMVWVPDKGIQVEADHPIQEIKRNDEQVEITKMLSSIPLGKLPGIKKLIQEQVQKPE